MKSERRRWASSPRARTGKLLNAAKGRADKKGVPFSLDADWLMPRLLSGLCEATGLPFSFDSPDGTLYNPFAPSLDRIDSTKGYTPDNTRVVITAFNIGRGQWGDEIYAQVASAFLRKRRGCHEE